MHESSKACTVRSQSVSKSLESCIRQDGSNSGAGHFAFRDAKRACYKHRHSTRSNIDREARHLCDRHCQIRLAFESCRYSQTRRNICSRTCRQSGAPKNTKRNLRRPLRTVFPQQDGTDRCFLKRRSHRLHILKHHKQPALLRV